MEVNRHAPAPQPPPPPETYDIIGLSRDEALFIRDLLGAFGCTSHHFHTGLFSKLNNKLEWDKQKYVVYNDRDIDPVAVLRCGEKRNIGLERG